MPKLNRKVILYLEISMHSPSLHSLHPLRAILWLFPLLLLTSCSSLITNIIVEPTVGNLQKQTDLELVCEGAPAYLLMVDSMVASNDDDPDLLRIGAQSYSGYVAAMAECNYPAKRIRAIADKAYLYGTSLLQGYLPLSRETTPGKFDKALDGISNGDLEDIFWGTMAWTTWIQQQQGSPDALADLVMVEKIMKKILELDESYQQGGAHLFFGALHAAKPEMLGGKPALSKMHFEKALELSNRTFLLVQVNYAETYARATMNQELHDKLLQEVINFPLERSPENALTNQIAKRKAEKLMADDYF